jgi:hypothetical protein
MTHIAVGQAGSPEPEFADYAGGDGISVGVEYLRLKASSMAVWRAFGNL